MSKYKIKVGYEEEVEAYDEEEAVKKFFEDTVYDTQSDGDTFIENNLTVEESVPKKFRITKFHDTGGDLEEESWDIEADSWEEAVVMTMEDNGLMVRELKGGVEK